MSLVIQDLLKCDLKHTWRIRSCRVCVVKNVHLGQVINLFHACRGVVYEFSCPEC